MRAVIDRAARLVDRPITCLALVVTHAGVAGPLRRACRRTPGRPPRRLSARTHIVEVERPFRRVLSVMPEMYDDLWTAAKGMYKLEPAVADGGEVVIYAPHITEVSYTHGALIDEIGYHCRDYFVGQWERFRHYPGGVLAHSTHVKGLGTVRRGDGRRDAAHPGDAGHGHSARAVPPHQPRLPGPGQRAHRRVAGTRGTRACWWCRGPGRCCTG